MKKLTISVKWAPPGTKKWLTLFAVILLPESPKRVHKKFYALNCRLSISLGSSELWSIMFLNQKKDDVKLTTLEKSWVICTNGWRYYSNCRKISCDFSLNRRELIRSSLRPEFRSLWSARSEPTDTLFGDDLTNYVKKLTMIDKLKRN